MSASNFNGHCLGKAVQYGGDWYSFYTLPGSGPAEQLFQSTQVLPWDN